MDDHWNNNEISTGFPTDFHWYFGEISTGFQIDFHLNFNEISTEFPTIFILIEIQLDFKSISIRISN